MAQTQRSEIEVPNKVMALTLGSALNAIRPPPKLTVSSWADRYRVLSRETSAEPGSWNTDRVSYMREPMDAFCDPRVYKVVCCFAAQTSKTESIILNVLGYYMHQDPAPILVVQPRIEDSKTFSKIRIAGMLRDSPALRNKVANPRARSSSNTLLEKSFVGGRLVLAGANSPAGLAGNPIRIVLADECDRYPPSAAAEGDPLELAIKRTTSFGNRKIGITSTPTDTATSRIWRELNASDFRQLWVPCVHCGEMQLLVWDSVVTKNDDPATAEYVCKDFCGAHWTEAERHRSVKQGTWIASKTFDGVAGFHLNALYAPWPNTSLKHLYKTWNDSDGSPLLKKTFVNTVLGLPWDDESSEVTRELPVEEYPRSTTGDLLVPKEVLVVTAGIDVQDNRLEIQIDGWGAGEEYWKLDYRVFFGDPGEPMVWNELWEYMIKPWPTERGYDTFLRAACCDTGGHFTQAAYAFCRPRFRTTMPDGNNCFTLAIKGQAGQGQIWHHTASRRNIGKVPLWPLRVDPAREMLYGRLEQVSEPGPGYVHFPPHFTKSYFAQLKSHRCVTTVDPKGFEKREWHKKHNNIRDEAFDTAVYSYGALCALYHFGLDMDREQRRLAAHGRGASNDSVLEERIANDAIVDSGPMVPSGPQGLEVPTWDLQINRSKYLKA